MGHHRMLTPVAGLLLLTGLLSACGDDDGSSGASGDGGPVVVATTTILGDVVASLVGDDATVEVLIPAGTDPHAFEPSARQAAELREADLIVANGLGLEAGLDAALDAAADDGTAVIEVAPLVDPLPFGTAHSHDAEHEDDADHADEDEGAHEDGAEHADEDEADHEDDADHADEDEGAHDDEDEGHEDEDGHDHDEGDPHFWHDPLRMAAAVPLIAEALVEADSSLDEAALDERADALVAELEELDAEVIGVLDAVAPERRFLLTSHDTLGYFADRYDFEVIGVVIPGGDTLASPSAGDLAELAEEIVVHDLPAIFAENTVATDLSETLADEVGREVEVVSLFTDSLGGPGTGADTYAGMLRTNATLVADALG